MKSFSSQLGAVQQAGEDFEWYPTTNEILAAMTRDLAVEIDDRHWRCRKSTSFLDIGAGNGKVLRAVARLERVGALHAIEKSSVLLQSLPENVFILGVDFWNTSLFDKDVGFIFSNPPYSRFEEWSAKILREAPGGSTIYLVIPERWQNSDVIDREVKARKILPQILGRFDFASAEDRTARAKVHLLKITLADAERWVKGDPADPFVRFFEEAFTFPEEEEPEPIEKRIEDAKLVHRVNFIEALCLLYDARLAELQRNYQAVCALAPDILKEFEISRAGLIESLRQKLATAKREYWRRLFDGMAEINRRLTASSRTKIVELMQSRTGIEFNRENAYAIVLWVIRHANTYFDQQLVETFEAMVHAANVENYVSNRRVFQWNRFRYDEARDERSTHFRLKVGHRIVLQHCGGLETGYSEHSRGLTRLAADFLCDLIVVARNLGFDVIDDGPREHEWKDSDARVIRFRDGEKVESLYRARAFHNRNLHLQFHPSFIHALNVQHGMLRGWLRDDAQAATELAIPREVAAKHFRPAFRLPGLAALPALTCAVERRED